MNSEAIDPSKTVDVAIAEFASLRAEILQKQTAETTLVGLNVTVLATLIGLAITEKVALNVLVVVPLFSSAIDLLILRHYVDQAVIGRYLRTRLGPAVNSMLDQQKLLQWEDYYFTEVHKVRLWFVPQVATNLVLPVTSLALLTVVAPHLSTSLEWIAWSIGAIFTVLRIGLAVGGLYRRIARRRRVLHTE